MSRIRGTVDGRRVNLHKTGCLSGCGTLIFVVLMILVIASACSAQKSCSVRSHGVTYITNCH